jgi:aryl-alcohol dehydrogenase-like predicted oxidoreductase
VPVPNHPETWTLATAVPSASAAISLRVERIDLYKLHRIDPGVPEADQFETLVAFQREGKVRHVGLSEVGVEDIERARKYVDVVSVQNLYNLADRQWDDVVDYCERENIGFIPWYPQKVGKLKDKRLVLAWLLKRSPVMLPIPGTSKLKHLEENLAAVSVQLSDEEFAALGNLR